MLQRGTFYTINSIHLTGRYNYKNMFLRKQPQNNERNGERAN